VHKFPGKTLEATVKSSNAMFIDFLKKCFEWVPEGRLTPEDGLRHPWIVSQNEKISPEGSVNRGSLIKTQPYYSTRKSEKKKHSITKDKFNNTITFGKPSNDKGSKEVLINLKEKIRTFTTKKIVSVKIDTKQNIKPKVNSTGIMIQRSGRNDKVKEPILNQTRTKLKKSNIF